MFNGMVMDFTAPTTRMGSSANRVRIGLKAWADGSNGKGHYCAGSYTFEESDWEPPGTLGFPVHTCESRAGLESIASPYFVAVNRLEDHPSPPFRCYQRPAREKSEAGLEPVGGALVTRMHYDVPRRVERGCSVLGVATKLKKKMQACLLIAQNLENLESSTEELQSVENRKSIRTSSNGCGLTSSTKEAAGHDMTEEYLIPEAFMVDREQQHVKKDGEKVQEEKRKKENWLTAKAPVAGYSVKAGENDGEENYSNGKLQEDTPSSEQYWTSWEEGYWLADGKSSRQEKIYPPPISVLRKCGRLEDPNEMPKVCWRAVKRDGKFVLQEEQTHPREFFRAIRENGRLRLQLLQRDEDEDCA